MGIEKEKKIIAVDIGGTSIKVGEYIERNIINVKEYDTKAKLGGAYVMDRVMDIISQFSDFEAIGISTAGQVDSKNGVIIYANDNIPSYTGMKVREILETKFKVPVAVENDVNAAAIGEACFGAGKNYTEFLCLTYGTGIGGAIVINRELYTGNESLAGEIGGIITHGEERLKTFYSKNNMQNNDRLCGCYERYASTTALVKNAIKRDATLTDGKKIFARISEPKVYNIVESWVQEVVLGLITLIHLFNPCGIILGGGVMEQKIVLELIQKYIYNSIIPSFSKVDIRQAVLGNKAGLLGAALNVSLYKNSEFKK